MGAAARERFAVSVVACAHLSILLGLSAPKGGFDGC